MFGAGERSQFWFVPTAMWLGLAAVVATWALGAGGAAPVSARAPAHRRSARLAPAMVPRLAPSRHAVSSILTPVGGTGLALYAAAGAASPAATLPPTDELGSPLVLLAVARDADWYQALLPSRPNGSTGWVRAADVHAATPAYRVAVSRALHQLRVVRIADGATVLTAVAGVGKPSTPTPAGDFYVRDLFPTHTMNHPYGPFAFGLSGHSDVLMHFSSGDGRIAVHGTDNPASVGADASNGCVHVANDVDLALIPYLGLGTPVSIA